MKKLPFNDLHVTFHSVTLQLRPSIGNGKVNDGHASSKWTTVTITLSDFFLFVGHKR